MKKIIYFGIACLALLLISACAGMASQSGAALSGTYYYNSEIFLTFNGNRFVRTIQNETDSGTYRISGNSIIFSRVMWGSDTWTILDSNTLLDPEDDLWIKQAPYLSGTYYYSHELFLTFNGNRFVLTFQNETDSGTYRILGNSIIFSHVMWGSDTWAILDSNTLLDPEDDLWIKD